MNTNEENNTFSKQEIREEIGKSTVTSVNTTGSKVRTSGVAVSFDGRLSAEVLHDGAVAAAVTIFTVQKEQKELKDNSGSANAGRTVQQYFLAVAQDQKGFQSIDRAITVYADEVETACLKAGCPLKQPNGQGKGGWRSSSTLASTFSHARKVREALDDGCIALLQSQGLRGAYEAALAWAEGKQARIDKAQAEVKAIEEAAKASEAEKQRIEEAAKRDEARQAAIVESVRSNPTAVVGDMWQQFMQQLQQAAAWNPEVLTIARDCALAEFGHVQVVDTPALKAA